jgi:hypothetical protein
MPMAEILEFPTRVPGPPATNAKPAAEIERLAVASEAILSVSNSCQSDIAKLVSGLDMLDRMASQFDNETGTVLRALIETRRDQLADASLLLTQQTSYFSGALERMTGQNAAPRVKR